MYTKTINLQDNEKPYRVNTETGEMTEVKQRLNNIPEGKSKLDYNNFGMINLDMLSVLKPLLSHTEISIIVSMIMKAEYNSNSLAPLNSETSIRELAETFGISVNTVPKVFKKLFDMGVYAQLKIATNKGNEFWILNPYIYWKGKLKEDSLFKHFKNTEITRKLETNI